MEVLITDCDHKDIDIEREIFTSKNINFRLLNCVTEKDVINECKNGSILINQYAPITEKVIENLPNLKLVIRYGVGVNNIDVTAATKLGVQVCNIPDYGMNEVADHAIGLMMALVRKIVKMDEYTRKTTWNYVESVPIYRANTQTVGVVGLGRIGRNFAKKARALDYNIIGYDPYYKPNKLDDTDYIESVTIEELIERSDIISIHCPLEGAENLFDYNAFEKMKKSAYIINVARGGIINEKDLDKALENKEIAGAALDCLEKEPVDREYYLFRHENLIVTPHMAWYSEDASRELKEKVAREAVKYIEEGKISYPVNKIV